MDSAARAKQLEDNPQVKYPSDKELEIYTKYGEYLSTKSIYILTTKDGQKMAVGASFLITRHGKYYLATNYHIIPGYEAGDSTKAHDPSDSIPDNVRIFFHSKLKGHLPDSMNYKLYNGKVRNFITIPNIPDSLRLAPKEVFDICFLPLDVTLLPKDVLLDTVNIFTNSPTPKQNDLISFWGYNTDPNEYKLPSIDTGLVVHPRYIREEGFFPEFDTYIYFAFHKDFDGNSGSPVYANENWGIEFVGMHCAHLLNPESKMPPMSFWNGTKNLHIGRMLTRKFIKDSFLKYVN